MFSCDSTLFNQNITAAYTKTPLLPTVRLHDIPRGLPTECVEQLHEADFRDAVFSTDFLQHLLARLARAGIKVVFIRLRLGGETTIFYPERDPVIRSEQKKSHAYRLSEAEAAEFYRRLLLSAERDGFPVIISRYDMKNKICPWCGSRYRRTQIRGG